MSDSGTSETRDSGEPEIVPEVAGTTETSTLWTQRFLMVLAALVSGGLLTAIVTLVVSGRDASIREREVDIAEAAADPQLLTSYWVGMPPAELTTCRELGIETDRCSVPENLQGYGHATVESSQADIGADGPTLDGEIACVTDNCEALVAGSDSGCGHGAIWLVVENTGSSPARSLVVDVSELDPQPAEHRNSFDFLRGESRATRSLSLGDLPTGNGVMLALGAVWVCERDPISLVPDGPIFSPERILYMGRVDERVHSVRPPSDVPIILSDATYWSTTGG